MNDESTTRELSNQQVDTLPGPTGTGLVEVRRTRRREIVKGAVAMASGVAAASYVKPTLKGLGVAAALAMSGGATSKACSIQLSITSIGCSPDNPVGTPGTYTISGTFDITNVSSDCGSCGVLTVDTYLQNLSEIPKGSRGCGADLTDGLLAHNTGSTGGSNPIQVGSLIPAGCNSTTGPYTFSISYTGPAVGVVRFTVEMTIGPTNAQQTGFEFKACNHADC